MDLGLQGKDAEVTGASKGIGKGIALALADEGANLAICSRGKEALEATEKKILKTGVKASETSSPKYAWLNHTVTVGVGRIPAPNKVGYRVFAIK